MRNKSKWLYSSAIAIGATIFFIWGYNNNEKKAYEEVLSTLSLRKLEEFLITYPDSPNSDLLIKKFTESCSKDPNQQDCYEMLLEAIPQTSFCSAEIKIMQKSIK